jgi:spermidine synthase
LRGGRGLREFDQRKPDFETSEARTEHVGTELRLVVDGAVQSVLVREGETPHGYWPALVPARRPRRVLILGLGGGTLVQLLRRRWPDLQIVGVEDDSEVLRLAQSQFGLDGPTLRIEQVDAAEFVAACREHFDLVVVDLYRGETAAPFVQSRKFIRRIRSLTAPGGTVVWNLHRDRRSDLLRRRCGAGLLLERRVLVGLNLVLHLQRRARRRASNSGRA